MHAVLFRRNEVYYHIITLLLFLFEHSESSTQFQYGYNWVPPFVSTSTPLHKQTNTGFCLEESVATRIIKSAHWLPVPGGNGCSCEQPDWVLVKMSLRGQRERSQQVRVLATKPDNLRPIPQTHMVEGKKQWPKVVLWPLAMCSVASTCPHTYQ